MKSRGQTYSTVFSPATCCELRGRAGILSMKPSVPRDTAKCLAKPPLGPFAVCALKLSWIKLDALFSQLCEDVYTALTLFWDIARPHYCRPRIALLGLDTIGVLRIVWATVRAGQWMKYFTTQKKEGDLSLQSVSQTWSTLQSGRSRGFGKFVFFICGIRIWKDPKFIFHLDFLPSFPWNAIHVFLLFLICD